MNENLVDEYRIDIRIADRHLANRLGELLGRAPGLRVAAVGEQSDLILCMTVPGSTGDFEALTAREREVLALLAEGLSNRAKAVRLSIATDTAKFHVGRVIDKLDATGRTDAVAHALRSGIIHL